LTKLTPRVWYPPFTGTQCNLQQIRTF